MKKNNLIKKIPSRAKNIFYVGLFILFLLGVIASTYYFYPILREFNLNPDSIVEFKLWVESHGLVGAFVVFLLQILQVVVSVIPGGPFQIILGVLFGAVPGFLLSFSGMLIGTIIVFLLTKLFRDKIVNVFIKEEQLNKYSFLTDSPKLEMILFVLFLFPGIPKDTLVYYAGFTKIPFRKFIFITVITRIPAMLSSTLIGSSIGIGEYGIPILIFTIIIVLGVFGFIYNKRLIKSMD